MPKKCIIIPAYNEEKKIFSVVNEIKKITVSEIIIIDDGSKDLTVKIAKDIGATVICHPFNIGYGAALQTGYKYAERNGYDYLIQMDGDGQHNPKDIPLFFKQIKKPQDVIIGSRFLENDFKTGFLKTTGIIIFRFIIQIITGRKITDPTSGYQCLSRKVFKLFTNDSYPVDYPDANIIIVLHRLGFSIKEIPVNMNPNPLGKKMHQGLFTILYYCYKMILSIFIALIREKSFYMKRVNK